LNRGTGPFLNIRGAFPFPRTPGYSVVKRAGWRAPYSTVTDFARLRGLSTSVPRKSATW
jgi:hypothetical protein